MRLDCLEKYRVGLVLVGETSVVREGDGAVTRQQGSVLDCGLV
jgi:hypothetical protein